MPVVTAVLLAATGCGNDGGSPSASSGASGGESGGSSGVGGGSSGVGGGSSGGGAPSAGTSSAGAPAPDGFTLAPGLTLLDNPTTCDDISNIACSGHCVTKTEETSGCQALATARIFSEVARDEQGVYVSEQTRATSM